jgi:hypothetical protein
VIASLAAVFAALAVGLPIFVLGERIREREERRNSCPFPKTSHHDREDTP